MEQDTTGQWLVEWDDLWHALAGGLSAACLVMAPTFISGALIALLIGAYREQGQMAVSGDKEWGTKRSLDVLFHVIGGGLLGGLFGWIG